MSSPTLIDGEVGPIAIHDLGGDGPEMLVICHATGFHGPAYRAFARELNQDVRVVAMDLRSHGDSAAPSVEADFSWVGMANDVARTIDHVNTVHDIDRLHGFGHSMGGAALLEVERSRPGTFSTAMVFEPIVPPHSFQGESPLQKAAAARLRSFPSRGHALERYAARPPLGLFRADVLHDYVEHGFRDTESGDVTLKCVPENEATIYGQAGTIPLEALVEVDMDVVVGCSGDEGVAAQLALHVADTLPNGRLLNFAELTHFGPLQNPVSVANEMRQMMAG